MTKVNGSESHGREGIILVALLLKMFSFGGGRAAAVGQGIPASILRTIPREKAPRPKQGASHGPPPLAVSGVTLRAPFGYTLIRTLNWIAEAARLGLLLAWDRRHGRRTARDVGRRLRETFERMGGTAIRIGQLAATRIDVLPEDLCDELSRLVDEAPPFALPDALERIERAAGMRATDLFEHFAPFPVASSTTANVYRATLKSGEQVIVKVRRPGVVPHFATDLRIVLWLTRAPEIFAIVREDSFAQLRSGFLEPIIAELDFARAARLQRLFRRYAKKARLRWLTSPKVFTPYCSSEVIVSQWVEGVSCLDLLAAVERDDKAPLAAWANVNITPERVARRLMQAQFWGDFEALVTHADPRPSNILILPDSTLVFVDFGVCHDNTERRRRSQTELMTRLLENDVTGMAEVALHLLVPLPPVDTYKLRKYVEAGYHQFVFALRDRQSQCDERAPMHLWLTLMRAARKFRLPVEPDLVQLAHAALLYGTLTCGLDGKVKLVGEYRRFRRRMLDRFARHARRQLNKLKPRFARELMIERAAQATQQMHRAEWAIETAAEDIPVELSATIGKGAYVAGVAVRSVIAAGIVILLGSAIHWRSAAGEDWWGFGSEVLKDPFVIGALLIAAFIFIRRALFRLKELDVGRADDS